MQLSLEVARLGRRPVEAADQICFPSLDHRARTLRHLGSRDPRLNLVWVPEPSVQFTRDLFQEPRLSA